MELKEYMRELWLMDKQYGQEEELYPLINILLRENINEEGISIRDIHNAQRTWNVNNRKYLNGFASVPDLVILDEQLYTNKKEENLNDWQKYLLCCVEAKTKINLSCDINSNEKRTITGITICEEEYHIKNPEIKYYSRKNTEIRPLCEIVKEKDKYNIDEISSGEEEYIRITPKTDNNNPYLVRYGALIKKNLFKGIVPKEINCERDNIYYKAKFVKCEDPLFKDNSKLFSQLFGELLWYGKVIYTDGKRWIFLELSELKDNGELKNNGELKKNSKIRKYLFEEKCKNMKQVFEKLDKDKLEELTISYDLIADMNGLFDKLKSNIGEKSFNTAWNKASITTEDINQWYNLKSALSKFIE